MHSSVRASLAPALALGFALLAVPAIAAADGTWRNYETVPMSRSYFATAYDGVNRRVFVFGGYHDVGRGEVWSLNDVWMLSLSGPPRWTRLRTEGEPPLDGSTAAMVYDPIRNRLVVVSGYSTIDARTLSLEGTPEWTTLLPSGTAPTGAGSHVALYDPLRDRMVVYGGLGATGDLAGRETWALSFANGGFWSQIATGGSPDGAPGGFAYDATRDRAVLFGGENGPFWTWALPFASGSEWEAYPSGNPNPGFVAGNSMTYDASTDRVVLFGGGAATPWTLQSSGGGVNWSPVAVTGPPGNRFVASVWDTPNQLMLEIATGTGAYSGFLDLWQLALQPIPQWIHVDVPRPPARQAGVPLVLDAPHNRLIAYDGTPDVKAVSLSHLEEWVSLVPAGSIPSRWGHTATLDPVRNRMLVIGGSDLTPQVWQLSLGTTRAWSLLATSGSPPPVRQHHTTVYDPVRDRMIVFGGLGASELNDVWALSLSGTPTWSQILPSGLSPPQRKIHSAIYDPVRDRMIVSEGYGGLAALADTWALGLSGTPVWTQLPSSGNHTYGTAVIYEPVGDRMIVFGGIKQDMGPGSTNAVRSLNLATDTWTTLSPSGPLPRWRGRMQAAFDPMHRRMITYGGAYVGMPDMVHNFPADTMGDVNALEWAVPTAVPNLGPISVASGVTSVEPNPGRGSQTIELSLATSGAPVVEIVDLAGRRVWLTKLGQLPAGSHRVTWSGRDLLGTSVPAGVYFARVAGTARAKRLVRVE